MKNLAYIFLLMILFPGFVTAQNKVDAKEIIARINRGEAVAYKDARIEGDLDMTQLSNKKLKNQGEDEHHSKFYISTVTGPVNFTNCTFNGKVLGYFNPNNGKINLSTDDDEVFSTNFEKEVRFEGCTFEQEANFKYSEFGQKVSFAGSRFQNLAFFKYSKFAQGPDFGKAAFAEETVFKYVDFPEGTNFSQANFRGPVDFKYAQFKGADFQKANFSSFANFKYAKLDDPVNFKGASFEGSGDFKYTRLNGQSVNLSTINK